MSSAGGPWRAGGFATAEHTGDLRLRMRRIGGERAGAGRRRPLPGRKVDGCLPHHARWIGGARAKPGPYPGDEVAHAA